MRTRTQASQQRARLRALVGGVGTAAPRRRDRRGEARPEEEVGRRLALLQRRPRRRPSKLLPRAPRILTRRLSRSSPLHDSVCSCFAVVCCGGPLRGGLTTHTV